MRSRVPGSLAAAFALLAGPALAQSAPALRLPGAGPVAGVVETRLRDGFDQRIRFEGGDGRNHAEVALRNETGDLLLAFPPRLAKPSQFGIESEMAVRFPGQVMRAVAPRRNGYGPVGMALSAECLYAWQWFERPSAAQRVASRGGLLDTLAPTSGRRALSLRIRLCRTAQASLDDLVAAVERMTIALPGEPGAAGRPGRAGPRPALVRRPPPTRARQAARPAPQEPPPAATPQSAPTPPPQQAAPPARPQVPAPPDSAGRRYIAPPTPEGTPPASPPEAGAAAGGAQRFITGVPKSGEASGRDLMPSPAPGRSTGESLSRDLPPEAYRPAPDRRGP
ncbi:cellulose biosynthesis protein BcsN [Methylobacterium sp. B4]|uniref:cellulose biosynthesis protein BcsN n=1 Tax=Methylobacterium sp. B4 TaxID=1938755 RepID=UPI000D7656A0|nr:cellulose biosynthesis protein BcsN [Methylobacterium sp. B4]PXW53695.1 hypothetical protein BY998_1231 [Methylobacterium sp. B4]